MGLSVIYEAAAAAEDGTASDDPAALAEAGNGGNVFSAAALHEVCAYEDAVMAYADSAGYCQRRGGAPDGECCAPKSYSVGLSYLLDKPCEQITDADLLSVGSLLRTCDAARAESCLPRWLDQPCHTADDCTAVDPHCHTPVAHCDVTTGRCVDKCEVPYAGMTAALRGEETRKLLQHSIGGTFFSHFMYEWLDAGFIDSGSSAYSRSSFSFVSQLHRRNGEDISMVKSKHQLLPLYNDLLQSSANEEGALVVKLCHEGVLQMDIIQQQLISDILHVGFAIVVVYLAIWAHTGSAFLTTMGMFHVLMAFPSAYTCYSIILGIEWMPLLNYIGIFVAIGVGADDIFVYVDAWRQGAAMLPVDCPLDCRVAWTLRRAGSAMAITSFTTCAAFLTNIVNYVVPLQLFGIFMGLMVAFDFLYTVTWFPIAVVVYHVYIEEPARKKNLEQGGRDTGLCEKLLAATGLARFGSGGPATLSEKTMTDADGDSGAMASSHAELRWVERVFRDVLAPHIYKFRLPIIGIALVMTIPLAAFMFSLQLDEGGIQPFPLWHDQRQFMDLDSRKDIFAKRPDSHERGMGIQIIFGVVSSDTGNRYNKNDKGELVFDQNFNLDDPAAQAWLLETAQLAHRLPYSMPAYMDPDKNVTTTTVPANGDDCESSLNLAFDSESSSSWQIAPCEVDGASGLVVLELNFIGRYSEYDDDSNDMAQCISNPDFCLLLKPQLIGRVQLSWAQGRAASAYSLEGAVRPGEWVGLSNATSLSGADTDIDIDVGWRSFSFLRLSFPAAAAGGDGARSLVALSELAVWGDTPSVIEMLHMISSALPSSIACGGGLPLQDDGASFVECVGAVARLQTDAATGNVSGIPGGLIFQASGRLAGVAMEFHTDVWQGLVESWQFSKQHPNLLEWNAFLAARVEAAPASSQTAWVVSLAFLATETQMALQRATYQSGSLALAIAFAVLLGATRSMRVSLLATVAIAAILAWTMGSVVLMGWKLGMMESTNIAILIGISVDFVVHFAHAYVHPPTSELSGTDQRVRHSLTTMGISVVAAAMTTFLSAMVLSMCTLTFFDKFGVFLSVTMVASTLLSVGFFQALLGQFGPVGRDKMGTGHLLLAEVAVGVVGLLLLFVVFSGSFDE
eukprot:SAG11_NODE_1231_length_5456_cov_3.733246_1_plen_1132_part_00